jgi:glycosyltransferase EpsF
LNQVAYQKKLEEKLQAGEYDIVHVHMNTMSVFALAAAKRAGIPVRICHNHSTSDRREGKRTLLKILLRPWNRLPATNWFACGKQAGEWMYGCKAVKQGKVFILPNAIETERFRYNKITRTAIRQEFGIGEDTFVVGHIGRFMAQKNHTELLHIFQRLRKDKPDAMLLLIGEGELECSIRELAREQSLEDKVIFAGVRSDVNRIYSGMDVFCLPSLYEGFPVVLLEAQANGLPIVCSNHISPEVCLTGLVRQLPLEREELWSKALLAARRREDIALPEEYEIKNAVQRLEGKYLALSNKRLD